MGSLLSVKFYAFTTAISLQENQQKVKGKTERILRNSKKFSTFFGTCHFTAFLAKV